MQPVARPTMVNCRKTSTRGRASAALPEEEGAVAAELPGRTVDALELAAVDLRHDVTGRGGLRRRSRRGEHAVAVELVDLLQRPHQARACCLWSRVLERLDEELGRGPAVHGE